MTDKRPKSEKAFEAARMVIPGGVNSPVRAFAAVGGTPPFILRGKGARLYDIDGNSYIDYVGSWGPLILGHADADVVEAVRKTAGDGLSFGAPTEAETQLAQLIVNHVPSVERVRLVSSGTEAVMSALRLARAATGREIVIKFAGCYHGHVDALLVSAGSGALTFGKPSSPGIPDEVGRSTLVLSYNDLPALRQVFDARGEEIAALILEPVAGNMGVVPPEAGFLEDVRALTRDAGALLIFDEVITGFRVSASGAQGRFGVTPDLTTLGKIIGGGLPVGAYGGRADLMDRMSPVGPVYQAGTLSGNPIAVAAGLATLRKLLAPGNYERLETMSARLESGLHEAARDAGVDVCINRIGSMVSAFFTSGPVSTYADVQRSDADAFRRFFHALLSRGVYIAPSAFESMFVSLAHTEADIDATVSIVREAFRESRKC